MNELLFGEKAGAVPSGALSWIVKQVFDNERVAPPGPVDGSLELSARVSGVVSLYRRVWLILAVPLLGYPSATVALPGPRSERSAQRGYARIEREVLVALNQARSDPKGTAAKLDILARSYRGTLLRRPTQQIPIQTSEGVVAVREAAAAARTQSPLPTLALSAELSRAARDHAQDQQRTGAIGHAGSDGSTVITRVGRYGRWLRSISENIDYSPSASGTEVIENLLVDDGVPDRGHRKNIFDPTARLVGIACAPHPRYTTVCVIVQTGGFVAK